MKLPSKWMLLFVSLFLPVLSPRAQEITGSIRGTIVDPSGATISGASVTATQIETGLQRKTTTDSDGTYIILALPVGHYRVEAQAAGFPELSRDRITLDVNQKANVSFGLVVGGESYKVEVNSDASVIETTATSTSKLLQEREILDFPL